MFWLYTCYKPHRRWCGFLLTGVDATHNELFTVEIIDIAEVLLWHSYYYKKSDWEKHRLKGKCRNEVRLYIAIPSKNKHNPVPEVMGG